MIFIFNYFLKIIIIIVINKIVIIIIIIVLIIMFEIDLNILKCLIFKVVVIVLKYNCYIYLICRILCL